MGSNSNSRAKRSPFTRTLVLERLEDRELLSASSFNDLTINSSTYDAHQIIVALRSDATAASPAAAHVKSSAIDLGDGLYRVMLPNGVSVAQGIAYYQAQTYVRYAQPDYVVSLSKTPNDPSFSQQWGLNNFGQNGGTPNSDISAPEAWNISTGSGKTIVAVIDTGVDYTHPDLAANIWTNKGEIPGNGIDDDHDGFVDDVHGWDFANNDNNPMDDNGHGTHVAGIIGAVGNNGIGVDGVNWSVQIMPLKFMGADGLGSLSNAIRALNFAVAHGATVSNNSYSGGGYYQAFYDAVKAAQAKGHIFVAAAGNNSVNTDASPAYPSSYNLDNIVSVAAVDRNDNLASFSNYGANTVDIAAPGVSIYSTYKNDNYVTMSGTSMAAPFVTGAIALLRDLHPNWSYQQVIGQVYGSVDPISSLKGKIKTGGRLNVFKALGGSNGGGGGGSDTTGPSVTSAQFLGSNGGFNKLRLTFSEAINASTFTAADIANFTRDGQAISGVSYTILPVSGTNNQFDITFTNQTAVGSYALTIGPDVRDVAGNQMNQNGNKINGETGDRFTATGTMSASSPPSSPTTFYSSDPPKALADNGVTTSTLTVGPKVTIGRISVKVSITHPNDADLRITLKSPTGATIQLFNQRGGSGDNISAVFDDRSSTLLSKASAPFLGWNRPEQALSSLIGKNAQGNWTLIVEDLASGNVGKLNSWAIIVDPAAGASSISSLGLPFLGSPADSKSAAPTPKFIAPPTERIFRAPTLPAPAEIPAPKPSTN